MTRMPGLPCRVQAESAAKNQQCVTSSGALIPVPQYVLPFAELLDTCLFRLFQAKH